MAYILYLYLCCAAAVGEVKLIYRCFRSTNCHFFAVFPVLNLLLPLELFCLSSPNNFNSLPLHIRSSDSLATFKSRLKSHLFSSAYHAGASDSTFDN